MTRPESIIPPGDNRHLQGFSRRHDLFKYSRYSIRHLIVCDSLYQLLLSSVQECSIPTKKVFDIKMHLTYEIEVDSLAKRVFLSSTIKTMVHLHFWPSTYASRWISTKQAYLPLLSVVVILPSMQYTIDVYPTQNN